MIISNKVEKVDITKIEISVLKAKRIKVDNINVLFETPNQWFRIYEAVDINEKIDVGQTANTIRQSWSYHTRKLFPNIYKSFTYRTKQDTHKRTIVCYGMYKLKGEEEE